ncbi:hypothetical protein AURDEDRAFT_153601 [Auricularia subglabra TFB-10046 SS5]|nr:hypothetical protein AURDEDRAFT_153601 [Auricularia subglabra TFB-10046 SS5]
MPGLDSLPAELLSMVLGLAVSELEEHERRPFLAGVARASRKLSSVALPQLYRVVEVTRENRNNVFLLAATEPGGAMFRSWTKHLVCELGLSTPAEVHPRTVIDAFCGIVRFSGCYQAFAVLAVSQQFRPTLVFLLDRASYRYTDYAVRGSFAAVTHLHLVFRPAQVPAQPISSLTPRLTHLILDADVPRSEDLLLFMRDVQSFMLARLPGLKRVVVRTVRTPGGVESDGLRAAVQQVARMLRDPRLCIDDRAEAREHTHERMRLLVRQDVRAEEALFEEGVQCWSPDTPAPVASSSTTSAS